jgi:hypothetical protein
MAAGLFKKSTNPKNESRSVVRNVTGETLEEDSPGASADIWTKDPIGTGLKNTQQLLVDWSDYTRHVFFNSAEAKVNLAFDQIVNGYPFDGSALEKETFLSSIGGFTDWMMKKFDTNLGYFNFNGNIYLEVRDQTGYYAPELTKIIGESKATENFHTKGATHEFWIRVPATSHSAGTQRVIYQKIDPGNTSRGVTIYYEGHSSASSYHVGFHIGSSAFKAIHHRIEDLSYDTWHHVSFVYERADTERVLVYLNGVLNSSSENTQAELDNIKIADGDIRIGKGSTFDSHAKTVSNPANFEGFIDELRVWSTVRSTAQIKNNMHKNVSAEPNLALYHRFNEPSFTAESYGASSIVLDYSGNGLHTVLQAAGSHDPKLKISGVTTPLESERLVDNYVLFPDWPPNVLLNSTLLVDANHYDRNNPNLITKLVPPHYFEEAQFFEGIEENLETPMAIETAQTNLPLPGHSKLPPRVVMLSFLLVWANFFDDIKLFIDSFSSLGKVTYDDYDQIPPQVIMFMSEYYGIDLPNPYANENPSKFRKGESLTNDKGSAVPLSQTIDKMWRRILINLPFLLRSRGTVQGIKALMNTLGIEADSTFRFKEFGGAISKKITSSRKKKKSNTGFLRFDKLSYIESSPLWAYRHEPGAPDVSGGPTQGEILFQSGDITITSPDGPPIPTLFTSGSWAWEGRYQLLKTETTSSLFRIENDDKVLVNLVAMRKSANSGPDFNLKLFLDGYKTSSDPVELELPNINLWDENPWYISVNNEWGATENTLSVRCIKTSGQYIVEHYSASIGYTKPGAAASGNVLNPGLPLFSIPERGYSPAATGNYLKYAIGTNTIYPPTGSVSGKPFDTTWNYSTLSAEKRLQSHATAYSGSLSHMRFWTKSLLPSEQKEHAYNPFSVSVKNPTTSFAFPNKPIISLNSSGKYETTPLGDYSDQYEGTLPVGSWERIRQSFDMNQSDLTFDPNLSLIDTSQNNDHITCYGQTGALYKEDFVYTIVAPDFDSSSSSNKVRIRSFSDKETADDNFAHHGNLTELPFETGIDDRRFSIESSIVNALNEDMVNVLGDISILNEYLGAPEMEYAVEYPEIKKTMDLYFNRLTDQANYNAMIEFQRWFNNNFSSLVSQFMPHTADFLGINFVIESHILERHKMEYKQGDVHVDIRDRQAFSQEPLILGTVRSEIT